MPPGLSYQYIRHVKSFADFLGRSPDKATPEDVRHYQLRLASTGTTVPTLNAGASALRFFFWVTLRRRDLAEAVVSVREPRRLPVVLSPEEVGRLLASTTASGRCGLVKRPSPLPAATAGVRRQPSLG